MNLSDLWQYPFPVEIYGTVAAWVGSLLTGLSIAAAARYYISDKKRQDRAQAGHVRFTIDVKSLESEDATHKCIVRNYSDDEIYDLSFHARRIPFKDAALHYQRSFYPRHAQVEMYDRWKTLPKHQMEVFPFGDGRIEAGESKEIDIGDRVKENVEYWIEFYDAQSLRWKLVLGGKRVEKLAYPIEPDMSVFDIVRYPLGTRGVRKFRRDTKKWLKTIDLDPPT